MAMTVDRNTRLTQLVDSVKLITNSPSIKQNLIKEIDETICTIAEQCLDEAKKAAATDKSLRSKTTEVKLYSQLTGASQRNSFSLIQSILEEDYQLVAKIDKDYNIPPSAVLDTLFKGFINSDGYSELYTIKVTWLNNNTHIMSDKQLAPKCEYSIKTHFHNEWKAAQNGLATDITFEIPAEGEPVQLKAHKMKLVIHSDYFRAQFSSSFSDKAETVIVLKDVQQTTFSQLLECIYCGELGPEHKLDLQGVLELYRCADYYGVPIAKEWCIKTISDFAAKKDFKGDFTDLLGIAAPTANEKLTALCFAHFDSNASKMREKLVSLVDETNWSQLYEIAKPFKKVADILLNCAQFNPKLLHLDPTKTSRTSSSSSSAPSSSSSAPSSLFSRLLGGL